jgi:preprotein translocase subunit SecG
MGVLGTILLIGFVISALLLIALVLIQDEGGEGLGGIFGGGASQQVGNRSGNILTKTTSILGAIFFLSSFGVAWVNRTSDAGDVEAAGRRLESQDGPVRWWLESAETQPQDEDLEGLLLDGPDGTE